MAVARQMKSPAFEKRVLEEAVPHSRVAHAHVDRIEPMSVFRVWLLFATLGLLALLVAISVVFGILAGTGGPSFATPAVARPQRSRRAGR